MKTKTTQPMPPNNVMKTLYAIGLGPLIGRLVLLLTTTGRKTGLPRVTPLQYEEIDGAFYLGSSRGQKADWFCNILANPHVEIRVKSRRFRGVAETVTDPARVADFLAFRLKRHPKMIGMIFQREGLPAQPDRAQLETYAARLAMVVVRPEAEI
jgi:deazaflavin-dependent oxidoreductase (nitroreductase family)